MPDLMGPVRRFYGFTGMIDDDGASRLAGAMNIAVNDAVEEVHLCISSLGLGPIKGIHSAARM